MGSDREHQGDLALRLEDSPLPNLARRRRRKEDAVATGIRDNEEDWKVVTTPKCVQPRSTANDQIDVAEFALPRSTTDDWTDEAQWRCPKDEDGEQPPKPNEGLPPPHFITNEESEQPTVGSCDSNDT